MKMTKHIHEMEQNQRIICDENTIIYCDVPEGANITMKNASLKIEGNIKSNASILNQPIEQASYGNSIVAFGNRAIVSGGSIHIGQIGNHSQVTHSLIDNDNNLIIEGIVSSNVKIAWSQNIKINNFICEYAQVSTESGDIFAEDLGEHVILTNIKGNIHAKNVGASSTVKTQQGSINVSNVGTKAKVTTNMGSIHAEDIGHMAKVSTNMGSIHAEDIGHMAKVSTNMGSIHANTIANTATVTTNMGRRHFNNLYVPNIQTMSQITHHLNEQPQVLKWSPKTRQ